MNEISTIVLLAGIMIAENIILFLFIIPPRFRKVTKSDLRAFIADHPDMFDADVLNDITQIVAKRLEVKR